MNDRQLWSTVANHFAIDSRVSQWNSSTETCTFGEQAREKVKVYNALFRYLFIFKKIHNGENIDSHEDDDEDSKRRTSLNCNVFLHRPSTRNIPCLVSVRPKWRRFSSFFVVSLRFSASSIRSVSSFRPSQWIRQTRIGLAVWFAQWIDLYLEDTIVAHIFDEPCQCSSSRQMSTFPRPSLSTHRFVSTAVVIHERRWLEDSGDESPVDWWELSNGTILAWLVFNTGDRQRTVEHRSREFASSLQELQSVSERLFSATEALNRTDRDDPSESLVRSNQRDVSSPNTSTSVVTGFSLSFPHFVIREEEDRLKIIRALEIMANLAHAGNDNGIYLSAYLDVMVNRFMKVSDILVLVHTFERFYQLSEVGEHLCNAITSRVTHRSSRKISSSSV